jgi:hypothetical protein
MDVSFDRFARSAVQAEATLTGEEGTQIQSRPLGQVEVDVTLTAPDDETTLVSGSLKWAWVPKDRLSEAS